MKKIISSFLALSLTGCAVFTGIDSGEFEGRAPKPETKVELYCSGCDYDNINEYFKYKYNANYELKINSKTSFDSNDFNTFTSVLSVVTLGILPGWWWNEYGTVTGELIDKETNQAISLPTVRTWSSNWSGLIFLPLMPFTPDFFDSGSWTARKTAEEDMLKAAARVIYDPTNPNIGDKWHCAGYSCRYKEIVAQKKTSAEDVLYVAENARSFSEFQTVKDKLAKPLTQSQNCDAILSLFKRDIVSRETQRFWSFLDYYKGNCTTIGRNGVGMTKTQLIDKQGIPTKGYKMNADTEIITYSSLSKNGESVVTTTYTVDRGIVTKIK